MGVSGETTRIAFRRKDARVAAEFEVQYGTAQEFSAAYTHNISRGGLYIQTRQPLDLSQKTLVRFTLPGTSHSFEVQGVVAWINFPSSRNPIPAGMGIKFLDLDPKARRLIADFVKKATQPALPPPRKKKKR